jgi:hypothetical protein
MQVAATPTQAAPPAVATGPWGAPVSSPLAESALQVVLDSLAAGADVRGQLGDPLQVAPRLWAVLARDPAIAGLGLPVLIRDPGTGAVAQSRAFASPRQSGQRVEDLLATGALRALATGLRGAVIRPATEAERGAVYAFISFEIAGAPVTVAELGPRRLVVLHNDDGTPWWLDLLP